MVRLATLPAPDSVAKIKFDATGFLDLFYTAILITKMGAYPIGIGLATEYQIHTSLTTDATSFGLLMDSRIRLLEAIGYKASPMFLSLVLSTTINLTYFINLRTNQSST